MKNLYKKWLFGCAIWIICMSAAFAQEFPMETIPLNDMSSFKDQAGNWFIVGNVSMNPTIDVHSEADKKKKRPKRKKGEEPLQAVTYQPGEGVLLNMNSEGKESQLVTVWEHGDIHLVMEVMLPKGSNSGIYLQGRYEVQLFDSWGVEDAKFSDMGGIYRNWEKEPGKIYMGKAPLVNAAKAPGLWQTLEISFRAPRFSAAGEKIANARFVSVELNGVKIHDNVEVPLPTGGPIENNEQPSGPLVIQGDHGPVAFRNIKYRLLSDSEVRLDDIAYKVYYGEFEDIDVFGTALQPSNQGTLPGLTWEVAEKDTAFGVSYTGTITIPKDDTYLFELITNGKARFSIDGQEVVSGGIEGVEGEENTITLEKGTYPFGILYYRDVLWVQPRLGLFVKSAGTHQKALHTYSSFPSDLFSSDNAVSPIIVETGTEPRLLRAFLDFKGDRSKRLTHTIAVGGPDGVHYIYDLKAGNLVCVWRNRFINATSMWHSRGDGSFVPLGLLQYLFKGPSLAVLNNEGAPFPEQSNMETFTGMGYEMDEATGRPIFKYSYMGTEVTDKIYPDKDNKMLFREVTVENVNDVQGLYFKLAEGETISPMPDGSFVIGEQYYIKVLSPEQPTVREVNGEKELVLAVNGVPIKYSIIW